MNNASAEDYLRTMYILCEEGKEGIKSVEVAKELNISKPSVSEMLRKLDKKGFVKVKPYSDVLLTKKGLKEAKRVTHNHRVIEVFLKDVLKYNLKDVHEEAHRLEHAFSQESIKRLDKFLENPMVCPHGHAIPHSNKD